MVAALALAMWWRPGHTLEMALQVNKRVTHAAAWLFSVPWSGKWKCHMGSGGPG